MKLAILGAAESGVGAAILAQQKGHEVFVSDAKAIAPHYKAQLDARGIAWEENGHSLARILEADELIKSPGIPDTNAVVAAFALQGKRVLSEIEFAARYTQRRMLCISGSNGKTTTTSLIYHILSQAGLRVGLAGNIGHSLALQIAEAEQIDPATGAPKGEPDWYVLEISSFQLDNMYDFRADVALLLNITPDHLDRYDFQMSRYVASKLRLLRNQRAEDKFIYWAEDEYIPAALRALRPEVSLLPFTDEPQAGSLGYATYPQPDAAAQSTDAAAQSADTAAQAQTEPSPSADAAAQAPLDSYGFRAGAELHVLAPQAFRMPLSELSLPGRHNLRNALGAAMACLSVGVSPEALRRGLQSFQGVAHRLEFVAERAGVRYINDSKATNVDACLVALQAQTQPVVLIIGGTDKGNDYTPLFPLIVERCRGLIYLGADNTKLHATFDALAAEHGIATASVDNMAACVAQASRMAQAGQVVLLSPCCASFDLFKNMADRGTQFKARVAEL